MSYEEIIRQLGTENSHTEKIMKESMLSTTHRAIHAYSQNVFIQSILVIILSASCLIRNLPNEANEISIELPVSAFYIMIAVSFVLLLIYGVLEFATGLPLFDFEKEIQDEKKSLKYLFVTLDYLKAREKLLTVLSYTIIFLYLLLSVLLLCFNYHAQCPHCNTEIPTNLSVCSECGSEVDFDKDIIEYIKEKF